MSSIFVRFAQNNWENTLDILYIIFQRFMRKPSLKLGSKYFLVLKSLCFLVWYIIKISYFPDFLGQRQWKLKGTFFQELKWMKYLDIFQVY